MRIEQWKNLPTLFRRKVNDQDSIDTCLAGFSGKGRVTHHLDRIQVSHQEHRGHIIALTKFGNHLQHIPETDIVLERTLCSLLNHRAISHWIGEGNPQLDHIGASFNQRMHQRHCHRRRRITCSDKGDQCGALSLFEFSKTGLNTAHNLIPSRAATVCISLSPRPERLIMSMSSLFSFFACFTA